MNETETHPISVTMTGGGGGVAHHAGGRVSLIETFAHRMGVEPEKMMATLKQTCFKTDNNVPVTNEQMMALLVVANEHKLNPFLKELYAFPDPKRGGIVPVVGVDGWSAIINRHPAFDGMTFQENFADGKLVSVTCTIHRTDRKHPTVITEYLAECKRATGPWGSHPTRMLRHKAMIQCGRIAFSLGGIYDEDEAERIIQGEPSVRVPDPSVSDINAEIVGSGTSSGEAIGADKDPAMTESFARSAAAAVGQEQAAVEFGTSAAGEVAVDTATGEVSPVHSFAQVADKISAAKTQEQLGLAADLIRSVKDGKHRTELTALLKAQKAAIDKGPDVPQ